MEVATIEVDREEARKRVAEFTANRRKKLTEMDQALYRGYRALAEGLTLVDVNEAIRKGGHFPNTYCPKLAIARADLPTVYFDHRFSYERDIINHGGEFAAWRWHDPRNKENEFYKLAQTVAQTRNAAPVDVAHELGLSIRVESAIDSPPEERKGRRRWYKTDYQTIVPTIPFHLRPNGDADKYFILWEVEQWDEWRPSRAPGDPFLLERIAHPIYVVVAQWDLSELEKRILESFRR